MISKRQVLKLCKELTDYEKFDLILKNIEALDAPDSIKNQMRLGAIKAYERSLRTGEKEAPHDDQPTA